MFLKFTPLVAALALTTVATNIPTDIVYHTALQVSSKNMAYNGKYLTPVTIAADRYYTTLRANQDTLWYLNHTSDTTTYLQYGINPNIAYAASVADFDPKHEGLTIPLTYGDVAGTNGFGLDDQNRLLVDGDSRWVVCENRKTQFGNVAAVEWVKGEIDVEVVKWCESVEVKAVPVGARKKW